ncbi:hypothetical protein [Mesorhizobium sp. M0118]|uniref:hypothetical protein n=1 Tax=Mesorhizobium sp. M0118 TaxID=2956884 RepID=UPI00333C1AF2
MTQVPNKNSSISPLPEDAGTVAARSVLERFAARPDVAREFFAAPFGQHSPELCFVVDVMRSQPTAGKRIAIMTKPYQEWRLARWSLDLPLRVVEIGSELFRSREDVERWVFRERWEHLVGPLKTDEAGEDV